MLWVRLLFAFTTRAGVSDILPVLALRALLGGDDGGASHRPAFSARKGFLPLIHDTQRTLIMAQNLPNSAFETNGSNGAAPSPIFGRQATGPQGIVGGTQAPNQRTNDRRVADPDFVPAKFYMNPGSVIEVVGEDNEVVQEFTSLPKGIALDTMEDATFKPTDTIEYIEKVKAQNAEKAFWLAQCEGMKPGETKLVQVWATITCRKDPTVQKPIDQSPKLLAMALRLAELQAAKAATPKS